MISIWTGTNGYLDDLPVIIKRFETEFLAFLALRYPEIPQTIAEKKALDDTLTGQLEAAVKECKAEFKPYEAGDKFDRVNWSEQ